MPFICYFFPIKYVKKKRHMKKKKIKRYKVSAKDSMCFAVSVVSNPATQSEFLVFSEQHPEKFVAQEVEGKHMIFGCALRADFPIYRRNDEDGEYLLSFDAEAIDRISKEYFKNGFQKSWTEAHEDEVKGLTITESWIKTSQTMDKSVALGLDPDIACGSWFIGCYCENEEIYEKCKSGEYNGFSVEALINMEEFESMVEKENEKMLFEDETMSGFLNEIRTMISDALHPQPVVEEPKEPVEEKPVEPVETPVEEPKEPDVANPTPEQKEEPVEPENKPVVEDNHLTELIENLRAELEALKGQNASLQDKVKELEKEPSAKPVTTTSSGNNGNSYSEWREAMKSMLG